MMHRVLVAARAILITLALPYLIYIVVTALSINISTSEYQEAKIKDSEPVSTLIWIVSWLLYFTSYAFILFVIAMPIIFLYQILSESRNWRDRFILDRLLQNIIDVYDELVVYVKCPTDNCMDALPSSLSITE